MPGLSLGAGAQVRVGGQPTYGSMPNPTTSAQAGFGPVAGADSGSSEGLAALLPNDPAGTMFWIGLGAVAGLLFIYYSLPR
jgi:hypothetical protein